MPPVDSEVRQVSVPAVAVAAEEIPPAIVSGGETRRGDKQDGASSTRTYQSDPEPPLPVGNVLEGPMTAQRTLGTPAGRASGIVLWILATATASSGSRRCCLNPRRRWSLVAGKDRPRTVIGSAGEDDQAGEAEGDRGGQHHDGPARPRVERTVE